MQTGTRIAVVLVAFGLAVVSRAADDTKPEPELPIFYLCQALEQAHTGSRLPVEVSGIMVRGDSFYDPQQPLCRLDVQPSTLLEFQDENAMSRKLKRLLNEDHRAYVRISGTLLGPQPLESPDYPGPPAALIAEWGRKRYGYHHDYRTKILVDAVQDVRKVPPSVPLAEVGSRPSEATTPTLVQGSLPYYPRYARTLGISGEVLVRVTIDGGAVAKTEVLNGNPVLSRAALTTVQSWRFQPDVKTVFVTTFVYKLQNRLSGEADGLVLEARLPYFVRVSAPADRW